MLFDFIFIKVYLLYIFLYQFHVTYFSDMQKYIMGKQKLDAQLNENTLVKEVISFSDDFVKSILPNFLLAFMYEVCSF